MIEMGQQDRWNNYCCRGTGKIIIMMMSSNGNLFRVTGPLCGAFTDHWWIPPRMLVTRSSGVFFIRAWINGRVNHRKAGDLRHHRAHYDVIVMVYVFNIILPGLINSPSIGPVGSSRKAPASKLYVVTRLAALMHSTFMKTIMRL